ncbi:MAG: DnaD domain protein [Clostridia bacterium]|nr:DnaD domain protein [Clostridia bacterium]
MPNFKLNMDFVPIPKDFIEHIMPSANAAYVMVYLYIMLLASTGKGAQTNEIAKKLGLIESDVVNAIKYWNDKGIFSGTGDTIIIKRSVDEEISPETTKKTIEEVSQIIDGNSALSDLCAIAQEILGKTLGNNDLETLYWFYDQLGFSPEVITMLLEYCVSMNKRNMKYIEKVAITWHENNITTMDEAQSFIMGAAKSDEFISSLRNLFGINDRNLSKTEKLYLKSWRDELGMSADMVGLAYEYCVMATNKLSFPYINTILKRWAEQGIKTIPEAEKDHEQYKQNMSSDGHEMTATDNISELEKQFMTAYEN